MVAIQIPKMHDTPHQSIKLAFHGMKFLLHKRKSFTSCENVASIPCLDLSRSKMKTLVKSSLIRIGVDTNVNFKISKAF